MVPKRKGRTSLPEHARAGFVSPGLQRGLLCAAVALLMYWATAGALFERASSAQCAVVVGATAGLIGGLRWASAGAGFAVLAGALTGPSSIWMLGERAFSPMTLVWVVLAAGVAALVAWVVSQRKLDPRWILGAIVAVMVANAWWTAIAIDRAATFNTGANQAQPPLPRVIEGDFGGASAPTDDHLYAWVLQRMRAGTGYYDAFVIARPTITPGAAAPTGVLNVREPLLYSAMSLAPNGWYPILALMALTTVSALSVMPLLKDAVKPPIALPGVAAVLSYGTVLCTTTSVLYTEVWSGMLVLLAASALAVAQRAVRWKAFTMAAVGLAVVAFLVREFALLALLAGIAGAWFGPAHRRRFSVAAWAAGLAAGGAAYAAHAMVASSHLVRSAAQPALAAWSGRGGLSFVLMGFTYNAHGFAFPFTIGQTIPYLLALLGAAGMFMLPGRQTRVFTLAMLLPLVAVEFVAGNGAVAIAGASVNYWGMMFLFTLYACVPAALAIVPIARSRAQAEARA